LFSATETQQQRRNNIKMRADLVEKRLWLRAHFQLGKSLPRGEEEEIVRFLLFFAATEGAFNYVQWRQQALFNYQIKRAGKLKFCLKILCLLQVSHIFFNF